jgi:hypothetical protein
VGHQGGIGCRVFLGQEVEGDLVQALEQQVIVASRFKEVIETAFQALVLAAQNLHLSFDQRNRPLGQGVGDLELAEQGRMFLEKLRVVSEKVKNLLRTGLRGGFRREGGLFVHRARTPEKTRVAGPVM